LKPLKTAAEWDSEAHKGFASEHEIDMAEQLEHCLPLLGSIAENCALRAAADAA